MGGNATRGMLGGGPASQHPRMQSQQIRGALPRTVMPVSSRYPQLLCIFGAFSPPRMRSAPQKSSRAANDRTTRAASAGLTIADSGGASALIRNRRAPSSSIQNHGADCSRRGESPLSGVAASCARSDGGRHGRAVR
jgi:hypothetical protein